TLVGLCRGARMERGRERRSIGTERSEGLDEPAVPTGRPKAGREARRSIGTERSEGLDERSGRGRWMATGAGRRSWVLAAIGIGGSALGASALSGCSRTVDVDAPDSASALGDGEIHPL